MTKSYKGPTGQPSYLCELSDHGLSCDISKNTTIASCVARGWGKSVYCKNYSDYSPYVVGIQALLLWTQICNKNAVAMRVQHRMFVKRGIPSTSALADFHPSIRKAERLSPRPKAECVGSASNTSPNIPQTPASKLTTSVNV